MQLNLQQNLSPRLEQNLELTLAPKMIAMLKLLNLPYQDLLETIQKEAEENVMLEVDHPSEYLEMLDYLGTHKKQKSQLDFNKLPGIDNISNVHQTLEQHLLEQLSLAQLPSPQHQIAEKLIGHLNADGYLLHYPEVREKLQHEFNLSRPTIDKVLTVIQSFEPEGVGARNLKECLLIQVREHNFESPVLQNIIEQIIQHHLEDLGNGHYQKIATALNIKEAGVKSVAEFIRNNLNPRPGAWFAGEERHIIPSFALEEDDHGRFKIINLETRYGPQLSLSPIYEKMLKEAKDDATRAYLKEKQEKARTLIEGLKKRAETQNKIIAYLVEHQINFLRHGENWIAPLLQKDIAQKLGVHPSTVSRALSAKYLQTRKKMFHLKFLCQRSWGGLPKPRMQAAIEEILKTEDKNHPLSDAMIKQQLQEKGILLSRRTITEYRKHLQIPASSARQTT